MGSIDSAVSLGLAASTVSTATWFSGTTSEVETSFDVSFASSPVIPASVGATSGATPGSCSVSSIAVSSPSFSPPVGGRALSSLRHLLYGFRLSACGILSASGGDSKYILNRFWLFFDS